MGLGAGLLYVPSLALIGVWFERRRAMAMGIVMSGIAVGGWDFIYGLPMLLAKFFRNWEAYANYFLGGVSYILMFNRLIRTSGFPWVIPPLVPVPNTPNFTHQAIRAMGFVSLFAALVSFPCLLSGSHILTRPRPTRKLFDRTALSDRLFLIYTCSSFFTFLGYIVPYFYIPTYAKDKLGMSQSSALNMLVIAIAASFFGRLAGGIGGHYLGSVCTWMLCAFASGVLSLCWISIEDEGTFIAFSILWGTSFCNLFQSFSDISFHLSISHPFSTSLRPIWPLSKPTLPIH